MNGHNEMYCYELENSERILSRISYETAKERDIFLKAPSLRAINVAGVEVHQGDCTGPMLFDDIEMGKKYRFKAGDPIKFVGIPTEVVTLGEDDFLKIVVGDKQEVEVYSYINIFRVCSKLEIIG